LYQSIGVATQRVYLGFSGSVVGCRLLVVGCRLSGGYGSVCRMFLVTLRSVSAVAGSLFERHVEAPSFCLLGCWTSRPSLVARCPWGDSTCARCANESPDEPSASSRQGRWPVPCSLRHTRPNLPGRGTSPLAVPGRPQPAGRRLIACSLPGSTGGSEGVPPACVTASPWSTTAWAYRHRAQEGRGERDVGTGTQVGEAPHPPLRQRQPPIVARRTGWGMGRHHRAWWRSSPAWAAPAAKARKRDNLLRTRGPQQPLSTEFVVVDSKASARTRVGVLCQQAP